MLAGWIEGYFRGMGYHISISAFFLLLVTVDNQIIKIWQMVSEEDAVAYV